MSKIQKTTLIISVLALILASTGGLMSCAKWRNRVDANGGILGAYEGQWVVIARSGGWTTDVWKIENGMVQSEQGSDGWLFVDKCGNAIHIGGDVKAVRITDQNCAMWDKYHEYHQEFEPDGMTYEKKFNTPKVIQ